MYYDYIGINLAPMLGIVFLSTFLFINSDIEPKIKRLFFGIIAVQFCELICFSMELHYSGLPTFHAERTVLSIIGYSIRPLLLHLILEISLRDNPRIRIYRILSYLIILTNFLVVSTALYADWSFGYTADNQFYRGALGFAPHAAGIILQIMIIIANVINIKRKERFEFILLFFLMISVMIAMVLEGTSRNLGIARSIINLCIIFYYMYFQSQEYRHLIREELSLRKTLEYEISLDNLTGLLNKKTFATQSNLILHAPDTESVLLIFMDLDKFKDINDTFGHVFGDDVLIEAAQFLKSIFRKGDLVSRFGGDEFCIFVANMPTEFLEKQLNYILDSLRLSYTRDGTTISISTSIGAVYCDNRSKFDFESLLGIADSALYESKESGRDRYTLKMIGES